MTSSHNHTNYNLLVPNENQEVHQHSQQQQQQHQHLQQPQQPHDHHHHHHHNKQHVQTPRSQVKPQIYIPNPNSTPSANFTRNNIDNPLDSSASIPPHSYHNLYSSPKKPQYNVSPQQQHRPSSASSNSTNWQKYIPPLGNTPPTASHSHQWRPKSPNNLNIQSSQSRNSSIGAITKTNSNLENSDIQIKQQKLQLQLKNKKQKICKTCDKPIVGTLVRAMDNVYHIDCFTCHDCHKPCSNKFFAADIKDDQNNSIQVPLCEYDYFKRIQLICYNCDSAIRGSYITALGKKYHPEHFHCDVCHKIFDSEDYYANDNKIYCHYHYSKLYAYHCQSCKSAILKQYVELYRDGKQQQWHPECFMVHKFWGVDITVDCIGSNLKVIDYNLDSNKLFQIESKLEKLTMSIWMTLSEFEESCASCISDMLHSATMNNKLNGLLITGKLILKIECLFKSIEVLFTFAKNSRISLDFSLSKYNKISPLLKEPRSLSSKIMSYLTFLRDIDNNKLMSAKYSQELLSLISTLAHYIKLISRNSLMYALEFNKLTNSTTATDLYLKKVSKQDSIPNDVFPILNIPYKSKDSCFKCGESIEENCVIFNEKRWHLKCIKCSNCNKLLENLNLNEISYNEKTDKILCDSCSSEDVESKTGFKEVSRFLQLIYLLKIALLRSKYAMQKRGLIDFKSNNVANILSSNSANITKTTRNDVRDIIGINDINRNTNENGNDNANGTNNNNNNNNNNTNNNNNNNNNNDDDGSYENQVSNITRMRSLRQSQKINNANNEIRKSIILEAPIASTATIDNREQVEDFDDQHSTKKFLKKEKSIGRKGSKRLRIEDVPMHSTPENLNLNVTSKLLKNEKSLTLDDIPRIVSSEQAREYRPNAFRFQKRNYSTTISNLPIPKPVKTRVNEKLENVDLQKQHQLQLQQRETKSQEKQGKSSLDKTTSKTISTNTGISGLTTGKRYSKLSNSSHEYMRHIAAFALYNLLPDELSLDDCLSFITIKKSPTFWEKIFGGANINNTNIGNSSLNSDVEFKSGSATATGNGQGVFGIALNILTNKYGVESDLGIGPEKLRIPMIIDELISVMHTQDLSAEGVFRLNGNIKRLRKLVEEIDKNPSKIPNLQDETPIQLAALMKKFFRDLPDPLLTFKLYDLFVLSQRSNDDLTKRTRILKLAYCMLPKVNRDLTEVTLSFLSWVSTFSHIDESNGSKMDIHNLATVLTPNILYSNPNLSKGENLASSINGENQFLAIEVINEMIEMNEELSVIPGDLYHILQLSGFEKNEKSNNLLTKDIITKLKLLIEKHPNALDKF